MRKTFVLGLEELWWVDPSQQPNTRTAARLPPSRMRQGMSKHLCGYRLLARANPLQLYVLVSLVLKTLYFAYFS